MSQARVLRFALLAFLPFATYGGTIIVNAACDGAPAVPVGNAVSCTTNDANAGAGVSITTPWNVSDMAFATGNAMANSFYSENLLIDFTGGAGAGFFVPCMSVTYGGHAGASASFGSVSDSFKLPLGGTCNPVVYGGDPTYLIPFVFGVTQAESLTLSSGAAGNGNASASFGGTFVVMDANHNVLTGTVANLQVAPSVPEPGTAVCVFCGLVLTLLVFRSQPATRRAFWHRVWVFTRLGPTDRRNDRGGLYALGVIFRVGLLVCLPHIARAGTVLTFSAECDGVPATQHFGLGLTCLTVSSNATANVQSGDPFTEPFGEVEAYALVGGNASAETFFSKSPIVAFAGGVGSGFFVPCLTLLTGGNGWDSASFGSVTIDSLSLPNGGTCDPSVYQGNDAYQIPFVFGVPLVETVTLSARSIGSGGGTATFNATFIVLDANHNIMPGALAFIVFDDAPEPGTGATVLCGLALALIGYRAFRTNKSQAGQESS